MASITDNKYVRLTTFTKDGRRKESPVWIADLGNGTVGFTTGLDSWKVKRIRNTPEVELTPSNAKGKVEPSAETVRGHATVVTDAEFTPVEAAIKAKYGLQVTMIKTLAKVGKLFGKGGDASNCGVVITLSS